MARGYQTRVYTRKYSGLLMLILTLGVFECFHRLNSACLRTTDTVHNSVVLRGLLSVTHGGPSTEVYRTLGNE
jgi:hypothetical protein